MFKIIKAFFIAILLTNCIYLSAYNSFVLQFVSPFLSIWGLFLLLGFKSKKDYFFTGFFTGILWLWWLGLSSIYFNLSFLVPLIILAIGLYYGLLFVICYLFKYDFLRLLAIFCLGFIHVLGFNWFDWQILSMLGVFSPGLRGVICIFLIAYFLHERYVSLYYKIFIIFLLLLLGAQYTQAKAPKLEQNIALIQTHIPQNIKFLEKNISINSYEIIKLIKNAINKHKSLIILPESSFAFALNLNPSYKAELLRLSQQISIIVGAFRQNGDKVYNSTYLFTDGKYQTFDKLKLVPFGENLPLFKTLIKEYFLPNMKEFSPAKAKSTYLLNDQLIANAICYEATYSSFYKNAHLMIALSNNAWFPHSSEYLLQNLLIMQNASLHGVRVYHSVNGQGGGVIGPKPVLLKEIYLHLASFWQGFVK